eukprot:15347850-Ditylum_brightwellii.AAC.1
MFHLTLRKGKKKEAKQTRVPIVHKAQPIAVVKDIVPPPRVQVTSGNIKIVNPPVNIIPVNDNGLCSPRLHPIYMPHPKDGSHYIQPEEDVDFQSH